MAGILGLALVGVGAWGWVRTRPVLPHAGPPPDLRVTSQATRVAGSAASPTAPTTTPVPTSVAPVVPVAAGPVTAVDIPAIGVTAPAVAVSESASGALGVPEDPATVGWWVPSPGVTVIDGHVDAAATGPGALFHLQSTQPGTTVTLASTTGTTTWTVQGVRTYLKGQLPDALFTDGGPRLVIITCGGPFDEATHHYDDNVVAYAVPVVRPVPPVPPGAPAR